MPSRRDNYIDQYARAVASAERYEQIRADIQDAQDRALQLENLASAERANLAALEETFRVRPPDFGAASEALRAQLAGERAARQQAAGARASREITAAERAAVTQDSKPQAYAALRELAKSSSTTAEELAAARAAFGSKHTLSAFEAQELDSVASAVPDRAQAQAGPAAGAMREGQGTASATAALFNAGPQGFFGGFDGEAAAKERANKVAPEGSRFATADDAFTSYLGLLEDGAVDEAEFAAAFGYEDAAAAAADFAFARQQYDAAKAAGAYTNEQRKLFEPRWLESARAVADLQAQVQAARAAVPSDPRAAAARRELQARGIDPDDPYLRHRGTPLYDVYRAADARFGAAGDVQATTDAEKRTVSLLRQYEAAGIAPTVDRLEADLGKTLQGQALQDALGFGLAYQRSVLEGLRTEKGAPKGPPLSAQKGLQKEPGASGGRRKQAEPDADAFLMLRQRIEQAIARKRDIEAEVAAAPPPAPAQPAPAPAPVAAPAAAPEPAAAPPAPVAEPAPAPTPAPAPAPTPAPPDFELLPSIEPEAAAALAVVPFAQPELAADPALKNQVMDKAIRLIDRAFEAQAAGRQPEYQRLMTEADALLSQIQGG